jgi:hypothetical protein
MSNKSEMETAGQAPALSPAEISISLKSTARSAKSKLLRGWLYWICCASGSI